MKYILIGTICNNCNGQGKRNCTDDYVCRECNGTGLKCRQHISLSELQHLLNDMDKKINEFNDI